MGMAEDTASTSTNANANTRADDEGQDLVQGRGCEEWDMG
jgi:hypothetical protein